MGIKNKVLWLQPFAISVLLVISFSFTEEVSLEADVGLIYLKKIIHTKKTNTTEGDRAILKKKLQKIFLIDPIFTKTMSNIKSKIKIEGASKTFLGHNF